MPPTLKPSPGTARKLAVAVALGCEVEELSAVDVDGASYARWQIHARDNDHAIEVFNAWASVDALEDPAIRETAARFLRFTPRFTTQSHERAIATRIHRFVRDRVRLQREETEAARSPELTVRLGAGDCNNQASIVVALARACGLRARVVGLRDDAGEIVHAVGVVEVDGESLWSETTIDAHLGEHPRAALRRLGDTSRADIGVR